MAYAWLFGILLGVAFFEGLILVCLACYVFAVSGLPANVGVPEPLPQAMDQYGISAMTAIFPAICILIAGILLLIRSILIMLALFIGKPFKLLEETADMTGVDIYSGQVTKPAEVERPGKDKDQVDEFGNFTGTGEGEGGDMGGEKGVAGSISLEDIAGGGGEEDEGGGGGADEGGGSQNLMVLPDDENSAPLPPAGQNQQRGAPPPQPTDLAVRQNSSKHVTRTTTEYAFSYKTGGEGGAAALPSQEPTLVRTGRTETVTIPDAQKSFDSMKVHSISSGNESRS